jgi:hypothetical protein
MVTTIGKISAALASILLILIGKISFCNVKTEEIKFSSNVEEKLRIQNAEFRIN